MVLWFPVTELVSKEAYEVYRSDYMCCTSTYHTFPNSPCGVCFGAHVMVLRLLKCVSPTCKGINKCETVWKVRHCTAQDTWKVSVNEHPHSRGALPCAKPTHPTVTQAMRDYVAKQVDSSQPPRVILVNLKKEPIQRPRSGWPTAMQLQNVLKRIRREQGTKNSIKAVQDFVRTRFLDPAEDPTTSFLFGPKQDTGSFAYVGTGDDDDAFIMGVTSLALLNNCLQYASTEQFSMFHADATFKLSDIGYPVITDRARSYQACALFVVSRRTQNEYAACFRSFAALCQRLRGRTLHVDAAMGDAEDAQYNAHGDIPEFSKAKVLMCFFHILYNVRKKLQSVRPAERKIAMASIMEMHFTTSQFEFEGVRDSALLKWASYPALKDFKAYFSKQWLHGRYVRWQVFHTPGGYATTNNPCAVFNAGLKSFLQRKRHHMRLLLQKLCELVEITVTAPPVKSSYIPAPTPDLIKAARALVDADLVTVRDMQEPECVRIREMDGASAVLISLYEDADFEAIFDSPEDGDGDETEELAEPQPGEASAEDDSDEDPLLQLTEEGEREAEKEKASKALALYAKAAKWSLRLAHRIGMPDEGWRVDTTRLMCGCKYYTKFLTCAHLVVASQKRNLNYGDDEANKKLKNRVLGKSRRTVAGQSVSKKVGAPTKKAGATSKKAVATSKKAGGRLQLPAPIVGRPPRTSNVMDFQFFLS